MPGKDSRTRYQGVFARHRKGCAVEHGARCRCKPSYYGVAYDRIFQRHVRTKRASTPEAARNARADLITMLERGEVPANGNLRLSEARERFAMAAREGKVLNKHGHRYKPRAIDDIEEVLRVHIEPTLGTTRITHVRRSDLQAIVDDLRPRCPGAVCARS